MSPLHSPSEKTLDMTFLKKKSYLLQSIRKPNLLKRKLLGKFETMRKVLVSEECDTFMLNSSKRVQDKFDYLLTVISQEQIVSKNFVDKLVGTDYYELRIKAENQVRVVVFSIDNLNFNLSKRVILLNAFIKKSTKDYKPAIAIADKLFNKYKDEING